MHAACCDASEYGFVKVLDVPFLDVMDLFGIKRPDVQVALGKFEVDLNLYWQKVTILVAAFF